MDNAASIIHLRRASVLQMTLFSIPNSTPYISRLGIDSVPSVCVIGEFPAIISHQALHLNNVSYLGKKLRKEKRQ